MFHVYDGHLLLALALVASTSRSGELRRRATVMGRERARYWMTRWPLIQSGWTPIPSAAGDRE